MTPPATLRVAEWYRTLLRNAVHGWLVLETQQWRVVEYSERAAELLQLTPEELQHAALPEFRRVYRLLQREPTSAVRTELHIGLPNGATATLEVRARLFAHEQQHYLWATLLEETDAQLITERLVLTDKLALLGQLLAGIVHEIRNPLSAIQLNLQLLRQALPENSPERTAAELALTGARRIGELVDSTLSFARSSGQCICRQDVHELLEQAIQLLQTLFYRKSIQLQRDYAPELPPIYADARQLQQAIVNLLTNAADAIPERGTIRLHTELDTAEEPPMVVITIEDNGVGIAPEELERIFEPFFTRKANGTGLGLPIARRIIAQHRGQLLIQSTPGFGTRCIVRLPIAGNEDAAGDPCADRRG
jgi:Signal transduction histidine kinase, nitrogen specific